MTNYEKLKSVVSDSYGKYLSSRMSEAFFVKNHVELVGYVKSSTDFYSDNEVNFTKRIMLILDGKTSRLLCMCGCEISPMSRGESAGLFRQFCSQSCAGKSRIGQKQVRTHDQQKKINDKRESTMLVEYGFAYNSQRPEVKLVLSDAKHTTHEHIRYDLLRNKDYLIDLYKTYPSTEIGEICNCDYSVVLDYLRKYEIVIGGDHTKISKDQREIADFIIQLGFGVEINSKVLNGQDIDIFIPSMNVGIEFNGFPWHLENFTEGKRGRNYHLGKTKKSIALGIRLIHVFPHDLHNNKEVIFSIIRNALGVTSNRVFARKCAATTIDKESAKAFIVVNHLKGNANFDTAIGLYHEEILVHVVTFSKSRYDDAYEYEVIRSASKINTSIIGGFSKCFQFFIKNFCSSGDKIMTYADRSISEGNSYVKAGFTFVRTTPAGYHYVERKSGGFLVHSRYKFQKHKLKEFISYADDKTEWEIMVESGYDRFWECGNNMYEYIVQ